MKISTCTECACRRLPTSEAMRLLAAAGFAFVDYERPCSDYRAFGGLYAASETEFHAFFEQERDAMERAGIKACQAHAPFPTWTEDREEQEYMLRAIQRAVFAASVVGSPYLVIHPAMPAGWTPDPDPERTRKVNYEYFSRFLEAAHKHEVKLALENMPGRGVPCDTAEALSDYIDMMRDSYFCACMDTGHANMSGIACGEMAERLGHRLQVLHIHDNGGTADQHLAPYLGTVDWDAFLRALKHIDYPGALSFEATNSERVPAGLLPAAERYLYEIGLYFMQKFKKMVR